MATQTTIKWKISADYLQACNCEYGCPCEFQPPPTQGPHCVISRIRRAPPSRGPFAHRSAVTVFDAPAAPRPHVSRSPPAPATGARSNA